MEADLIAALVGYLLLLIIIVESVFLGMDRSVTYKLVLWGMVIKLPISIILPVAFSFHYAHIISGPRGVLEIILFGTPTIFFIGLIISFLGLVFVVKDKKGKTENNISK